MSAMKLKKDSIKSKNKAKFSQQIIVIAVVFIAVAVILYMNYLSSAALRDVVEVVVLKANVPKDGVLTQANFERREMVRAEYEKYGMITLANGARRRAIVLWEDRGGILNTFAAYYLRSGSPIYWDSLTRETPRKNSYLYQMDGELMKLDVTTSDFGELIVPGDRLNIRVSYSEKDYRLPSEEEYYAATQNVYNVSYGGQNIQSIERYELLFNEVRLLDILNSKGESVFDIYYNLIAMPKREQIALVESDDFKSQVKATTFLLAVTAEEADNYMRIQGKSPSYMITLLPRTGSNVILESLNELLIGTGR